MAARPSALRKAVWWGLDYVDATRRQLRVLAPRGAARRWAVGDEDRPELVLLPGVIEHWTFLEPLGDRLHRAGFRVRVVHGIGANTRPIDETALRVAAALGREPVPAAGRIVVAHSKGGLIGKRLLIDEETGGDGAPTLGLLGVVAIATPFHGARRARLIRHPSVRAFLPDDPTIRALAAAAEADARIVSISGPYDPHVPEGSDLALGTNLHVATPGHFRVLAAPETAEAVLEGVRLLVARTAQADGPA
ncbi:esterase/lipase family protein [Agromyces seonyuensis]|uniref:Alpha/beta hydrolase n=1 Tax=Agromyces seonyuensis TaxID=2662446 RepID=A0A6I4P550_9MICO|nr:hypothetical protein [Agromyces seonyuensis]MWB99519.1 hypothetical protein [Agromyces seonyuensis]